MVPLSSKLIGTCKLQCRFPSCRFSKILPREIKTVELEELKHKFQVHLSNTAMTWNTIWASSFFNLFFIKVLKLEWRYLQLYHLLHLSAWVLRCSALVDLAYQCCTRSFHAFSLDYDFHGNIPKTGQFTHTTFQEVKIQALGLWRQD